MLGPFATASRRTPPVLHCHSPGVATVARRLRIDVHNNIDNNDNAWQRGPLWPHGMGPTIDPVGAVTWRDRSCDGAWTVDRTATWCESSRACLPPCLIWSAVTAAVTRWRTTWTSEGRVLLLLLVAPPAAAASAAAIVRQTTSSPSSSSSSLSCCSCCCCRHALPNKVTCPFCHLTCAHMRSTWTCVMLKLPFVPFVAD